MKFLNYISLVVVTICSALFFGACSIFEYGEEPNPLDDPNNAILVLRLGTTAPSRAETTKERMYSLRVVLLGEDGNGNFTVEYNDFVDSNKSPELFEWGNGVGNSKDELLDYSVYRLIPTKPGKKKIFLVANEESAQSVNSSFGTGTTLSAVLGSANIGAAGFEELVNSVYFTPDYSDAELKIIYSSVYDFEIADDALKSDTRKIDKTFWLVPAATKFDFTFDNRREEEATIGEITISSIAEDMYLMAHVGAGEMYKQSAKDSASKYWVDWLRDVSDDTTEKPDNPDNKDVNAKYLWLTDYELPASVKEHFMKSALTDISVSGGSKRTDLEPLYLPESKFNPGDDGFQTYALTIKVNGVDNDFVENLPLLKTLFRNTHVKVDVRLNNKEDNVEVTLDIVVCPWDSADIELPPFD